MKATKKLNFDSSTRTVVTTSEEINSTGDLTLDAQASLSARRVPKGAQANRILCFNDPTRTIMGLESPIVVSPQVVGAAGDDHFEVESVCPGESVAFSEVDWNPPISHSFRMTHWNRSFEPVVEKEEMSWEEASELGGEVYSIAVAEAKNGIPLVPISTEDAWRESTSQTTACTNSTDAANTEESFLQKSPSLKQENTNKSSSLEEVMKDFTTPRHGNPSDEFHCTQGIGWEHGQTTKRFDCRWNALDRDQCRSPLKNSNVRNGEEQDKTQHSRSESRLHDEKVKLIEERRQHTVVLVEHHWCGPTNPRHRSNSAEITGVKSRRSEKRPRHKSPRRTLDEVIEKDRQNHTRSKFRNREESNDRVGCGNRRRSFDEFIEKDRKQHTRSKSSAQAERPGKIDESIICVDEGYVGVVSRTARSHSRSQTSLADEKTSSPTRTNSIPIIPLVLSPNPHKLQRSVSTRIRDIGITLEQLSLLQKAGLAITEHAKK